MKAPGHDLGSISELRLGSLHHAGSTFPKCAQNARYGVEQVTP